MDEDATILMARARELLAMIGEKAQASRSLFCVFEGDVLQLADIYG
jgi:hypothetical protein